MYIVTGLCWFSRYLTLPTTVVLPPYSYGVPLSHIMDLSQRVSDGVGHQAVKRGCERILYTTVNNA